MDEIDNDKNVELQTTVRIELIGFSTVILMVAYYLWTVFGYLDLTIDILQWVFTIFAFAIIAKALFLPRIEVHRLTDMIVGIVSFVSAALLIYRYGITNVILLPVYVILIVSGFYMMKNAFSGLKNRTFRKIVPVSISSVLFLSSIFISDSFIYPVLILVFILIFVIFNKNVTLSSFSIIAVAVVFAVSMDHLYPYLGTDELTLDLYAARVFFSGHNPYIASAMSNAFHYYNFPLSMTTPYSTGGYVENFSYPFLIVLILAPAEIFGFNPGYEIIFFTALLFFMIFLHYRREGFEKFVPIAIATVIVDVNIFTFADGSVPDAIWVFFLLISLFFIDRPVKSSLFYGLSISIKQIPLILFPFLIYYVYKTAGKKYALIFIAVSAIVFAAVNSYFLIVTPVSFINSILSPETSNLLGVGQGISILTFTGIYSISQAYYTLMMIFFLFFLLAIYIRYFEKAKYIFVAFPILIFFFNYRFLFNYIVFWPLIAIFMLPIIMKKSSSKFKRENMKKITAMIVIALAVPAASAVAMHQSPQFQIEDISSYVYQNSTIAQMNVNITFESTPINDMQFRMFPYGSLGNLNGYMWKQTQAKS
ncbi:MAG: hypothetical protein ACP5UV_05565, partial [Thermoplasmata archaeon]